MRGGGCGFQGGGARRERVGDVPHQFEITGRRDGQELLGAAGLGGCGGGGKDGGRRWQGSTDDERKRDGNRAADDRRRADAGEIVESGGRFQKCNARGDFIGGLCERGGDNSRESAGRHAVCVSAGGQWTERRRQTEGGAAERQLGGALDAVDKRRQRAGASFVCAVVEGGVDRSRARHDSHSRESVAAAGDFAACRPEDGVQCDIGENRADWTGGFCAESERTVDHSAGHGVATPVASGEPSGHHDGFGGTDNDHRADKTVIIVWGRRGAGTPSLHPTAGRRRYIRRDAVVTAAGDPNLERSAFRRPSGRTCGP